MQAPDFAHSSRCYNQLCRISLSTPWRKKFKFGCWLDLAWIERITWFLEGSAALFSPDCTFTEYDWLVFPMFECLLRTTMKYNVGIGFSSTAEIYGGSQLTFQSPMKRREYALSIVLLNFGSLQECWLYTRTRPARLPCWPLKSIRTRLLLWRWTFFEVGWLFFCVQSATCLTNDFRDSWQHQSWEKGESIEYETSNIFP